MAEHGPGVPPYGTAIQQAIAKGDLPEMKALVARAERYLQEIGNLSAAIEVLKVEIAKREAKQE
jgi:hypothetical protein